MPPTAPAESSRPRHSQTSKQSPAAPYSESSPVSPAELAQKINEEMTRGVPEGIGDTDQELASTEPASPLPYKQLLRPQHEVDAKSLKASPSTRNKAAAYREELGTWLKKLANVDDRAFNARELREIRLEIKALHAEVKTFAKLNRHQQEAIDKLLAEVQNSS